MSFVPEATPALALALLVEGREDHAARFITPTGAVLVVADGAGGTGSGHAAAAAVVAAVGSSCSIASADGWAALLARIDAEVIAGETTAVVCSVDGDRIVGASVGDSGALLVDHVAGRVVADLTEDQRRKPLIGSRWAVPIPFTANLGEATLLLASDGLLKYTSAAQIGRSIDPHDLDGSARRLVDLLRLRSGALPDDVAIVLACRGAAAIR